MADRPYRELWRTDGGEVVLFQPAAPEHWRPVLGMKVRGSVTDGISPYAEEVFIHLEKEDALALSIELARWAMER